MKNWNKYWTERKIDWVKSYQNWDHPHRFMISAALKSIKWLSLFEVGCGGGANLINIVKHFPNVQVGGIDLNPEAVETCQKTFQNALFKVGGVEDIMLSDNSVDIILSDMTLIYLSERQIERAIKEIKRVARNHIILCEFHHPSWIKRWQLWLQTGYNSYNYKKLLQRNGFYDILTYKIPLELWPGGEPQKTFGYIVTAKVPKRK